jgi:hypothetical protein
LFVFPPQLLASWINFHRFRLRAGYAPLFNAFRLVDIDTDVHVIMRITIAVDDSHGVAADVCWFSFRKNGAGLCWWLRLVRLVGWGMKVHGNVRPIDLGGLRFGGRGVRPICSFDFDVGGTPGDHGKAQQKDGKWGLIHGLNSDMVPNSASQRGLPGATMVSIGALNAKGPGHFPPPVYYSGPDFTVISAPTKSKTEFRIERNVTKPLEGAIGQPHPRVFVV